MNSENRSSSGTVAICGGGPAGLFAATTLASARPDLRVRVFEAKPGFGRKFLLAGRGGLNLTNARDGADLTAKYAHESTSHVHPVLRDALLAFGSADLRAFAESLGVETFTGPSGRVFPRELRASPMLRAWLARLRDLGVELRPKHRLENITADGSIRFETPEGPYTEQPDATVLALGGASWPKTGSDAAWVPLLRKIGVEVRTMRPANCGFEREWSARFADRFAGQPLKNVRLWVADHTDEADPHDDETMLTSRGEILITCYGIEGGGVYELSRPLRRAMNRDGIAHLHIDLKPDLDEATLAARLARARPKESRSTILRKLARLSPLAIGLLGEDQDRESLRVELARRVKNVTLALRRTRPIEEAISTAGGVAFDALDEGFRLRAAPRIAVAGEMLDWEAPTGGYLLQGCFATGHAAALAIARSVSP